MLGMGMGMLWPGPGCTLGTKGAVLADSTWRLLLGAAGGEDTERLLNTADTPSPNSNSGEELRGVLHTVPRVPGSGPPPAGGWSTCCSCARVSGAVTSLRSRNCSRDPDPGPGCSVDMAGDGGRGGRVKQTQARYWYPS